MNHSLRSVGLPIFARSRRASNSFARIVYAGAPVRAKVLAQPQALEPNRLTEPKLEGATQHFLMQEFNREANTLSSKSQDLATTRIAVDMKVLIEQMREQVQNIE